MKLSRILLAISIIITLSVSIVFATSSNNPNNLKKRDNKITQKQDSQKYQDPINFLEIKKQKIQTKVNEGKISKDKAQKIIKKIDTKIRKIKDFNKLSPQQKKNKLINGFITRINQKVKGGKLDRDKADKIIKEYNNKINQWDGNGYPRFKMKHFRHKRKQ